VTCDIAEGSKFAKAASTSGVMPSLPFAEWLIA